MGQGLHKSFGRIYSFATPFSNEHSQRAFGRGRLTREVLNEQLSASDS